MDELTEYLTNNVDDGFWDQIQSEARREADREPVLVSFLFASVLVHKKLEDGLSVILANKLHTPELPAILLRDLINNAFTEDVSIRGSMRADLLAARTGAVPLVRVNFGVFGAERGAAEREWGRWYWKIGRPSLTLSC